MPGNANSGGHNAKTLDKLKMDGTIRPDRHGGFKNMDVPQGRPDTPEDLDGDALVEWDQMVQRLERCGALSSVDDAVIYQYAKLAVETRQLEKEAEQMRERVEKLTRMAEKKKLDGNDFVNAMHEINEIEKLASRCSTNLRMSRMAMRQYLVEFGMTPSARGRVKMPGDQSEARRGKLMSFRGGKR